MCRKAILYMILVVFGVNIQAQRVYKNSSVLASGNWFKIGVKESGVYKIDIPLNIFLLFQYSFSIKQPHFTFF